MTTQAIRQSLATSQRRIVPALFNTGPGPEGFAGGPAVPPPPPANMPAGAAAGPVQPDSHRGTGNGSAAAPSPRIVDGISYSDQFWSDLPPPGAQPKKSLAERIESARSDFLTAPTGYERNDARRRLERLMKEAEVDAPLIERRADTVRMKAIDWLWKGWIARGYINLIVGETGAGKSTAGADIVARITTGRPWPGEDDTDPGFMRAPGRALWLGSEDGHEEMTVPRLEACRADTRRVTFIDGVKRAGKRETFSLQDDIDKVRKRLIKARQEEHGPFTALVVDPITSYLSGERNRRVNPDDSTQIRSILEPWMALAQEERFAILGYTHLSKDTSRSMLHRVMHSQAFAATCRSLLGFVALKEQNDPWAKVMFQLKTNLPEHPGGAWRFHTKRVELGVDVELGKPIVATMPIWDELDTTLTPDNVVGGQRGPVSQYGFAFPMWLKAQFITTPPTEGRPVADIKRSAIADGVVTERWWNEHSQQYLDKRNVGGTWMCRPKAYSKGETT